MSTTTTTLTEPSRTQDVELSHLPHSSADQTTEQNRLDEPAEHSKPSRDWQLYFKLLSCGASFFFSGLNDGSLGALLPYVIRSYGLTAAIASSVYAANFFGWLAAALINTHINQYFDLGAMLTLGAALQVLAQVLRAWQAPFPLYVVTFWITSVGQAFQDTHANSYVAGATQGAHRWLGFVHSCYMAGCLVAPFAAAPIASASEPSVWYLFYTVPLAVGVANLIMCVFAFRETLRMKSRAQTSESEEASTTLDENGAQSRQSTATELVKKTVRQSSLWYISIFFFFYLGMTLTASGWVVEYLVDARDGDLDRVSVPNIIAASIAISLFGFFSGPLFAAAMSVGSRLFSSETKSTALALVFVFAQMGGSLFPIITGQLATRVGVWVLQPVLVSLIVVTGICWFVVPKPKDTENDELHVE
ncbi:hypothetical protein Q7P37_005966 [Cladosporium fusiforme]